MPEYARLTTSALSAHTNHPLPDQLLFPKLTNHREGQRTVAEQVQERRMLVDRFLDAQDADLPELVVQDPLAERRLDDVRPVEAVVPVPGSRRPSVQLPRGGAEKGGGKHAPVHAVGPDDRSLLPLRLPRRRHIMIKVPVCPPPRQPSSPQRTQAHKRAQTHPCRSRSSCN